MSSSESEDENLKRFAEAVDTTVFSDNLYNENIKADKPETPKIELKSQRVIDTDENIFQSEINVSNSMKQFIGKKLSKLIEDQVEFVDVKVKNKSEDSAIDNVRLLRGSKETVKDIDESWGVENRQKVPIKRRKIEDDQELKEVDKVKKSSIDLDVIQDEVKSWKNKPKHEAIDYKSIKGIGYIRETKTEFTNARNKNNWTEAKIKTAKFHNTPMHK